MGKGFKNVNVSFIGTHEHSEKIPQWVKANGGTYSRDVDEYVTHLVATESAVKKNVDAVKKAKRLNIKIVTYDWLEDSLLSKGCKPKHVGPYLWDRVLKGRKSTKTKKKTSQKTARQKKQRGVDPEKSLGEFRKGARAIVSDMEDLGYHLYVDSTTGATYTATLVRSSLLNNRFHKETVLAKVSGSALFAIQPHPNPHLLRTSIYNPFAQEIQVYETNDAPHTYATFVKYSRTGASGKDILAPRGSTLDFAIYTFEKFFKMKTGLEWKDRYDDSKLPKSETKENGELFSPSEGWFTFQRPTGLMGSLRIDAEKSIVGNNTNQVLEQPSASNINSAT